MDTIFDSPRWTWRLRRQDAELGPIGNHRCWTTIVIPGDNETEVIGDVDLVPPSEAFFFLRARGVAADAETYFTIVLRDNRAYVHLYAQEEGKTQDWVLFYWTHSKAPKWVKGYLKARR